MSLTQEEWRGLSSLNGNELKERVFSLLQQTAIEIQSSDNDDPNVLSVIPRLAALIDAKPELSSYREVFGALARSVGLWNYIDKAVADARDELIAEAVTIPELDGITLHRKQIDALNLLLSGKNLILSAPTSFGKSILIDALLASGKFKRVAIVLPTIALLDEFRRRLIKTFGKTFPIVMYHSDKPPEGNVIFLSTHERLINRQDLGRLDLAVVDEFYKLDPNRDDDRSLTLNAVVYQLLKCADQFFFLGPNIQNVRYSSDTRWAFEFLETKFVTVAVDSFDLRGLENKFARLTEELRNPFAWPALVFASGPDRANHLASNLVRERIEVGTSACSAFAAWIDENFGPGWDLSTVVSAGIGIHHGRIPRAVASHFIRLFNAGDLPILICTSTLIEGVNTAAKSIMIYDKIINRKPYDFFTFANIRGRAGRLGRHRVGSVYLFHEPPEHKDLEVEPPLFGNLDEAPDELVVHIASDDASPTIGDRVREIGARLSLDPAELKIASSVGLEDALALKQHTEEAYRSNTRISWSGFPSYPEILAVCEIICKVRQPQGFGVKSPRQLAYFLKMLRLKRPMRMFFHWYAQSYLGSPSAQDNVFKFLRSCEYGLPQLFAVVELFAKKLDPEIDYSRFIVEMPRWFRPEILKHLDEQGVPIQISEKYFEAWDDITSLTSKLIAAAETNDEVLSEFERHWIIEALPSGPSQLPLE
ncbi:MAG TPA: DEAD/DEAH box helicase [Microvirga sp.]|nr:DEAD/DEAH box helicase [Microvirga sp.]